MALGQYTDMIVGQSLQISAWQLNCYYGGMESTETDDQVIYLWSLRFWI